MRKKRLVSAVLLVLLLAGCGQTGGKLLPSGTGRTDTAAAQAELDVQLGLLKDEITAEERREALDLWSKIRAIQTERKAKGNYERSDYEWRLLRRLSGLYDAYTIRYLGGDEEGFGYRSPRERTLAVYQIGAGDALTPDPANDLSGGAWSETELLGLWEEMCTLLPEGAFEGFDQFTVFTDGPEETVAYVWALDDAGARWEIAVDPADAEDREYFVETVLHEYFHYLSLNDTQVIYTSEQTLDTYNEPGMVTLADSYLNDFYQEFWTGYLDDCLACDDTYNFFLRHCDDFITPYASTDPSEDICESFAFFVLRPRDFRADEDVWSRKLDFFYQYPQLVAFREEVRGNLELAWGEYFESRQEADAA
ncbi:hypothetical protein [Intestinimonas butyriciproducens]|uniref:hypothetical protein n=1 Tax=Intestinimonas butyriciproducens TaxID=1297617 RepID=UPI00189CDA60|nr:hypothetical protein [Intestinimonas butyriciproducens]